MVGLKAGVVLTGSVAEDCREQWGHVVVLISVVTPVPFALPH